MWTQKSLTLRLKIDMKPEELMIGDWVSLFQGSPDLSSCNAQVTFIGEYGEVGIEGCEEYTSANCNLLFPIPITPEILEKNGFDMSDKEVMQYHFEEDGEKYHFSLRQMYDKDGKPHGYSFYSFNVLTLLDYVHQLQHALKLCGINKEIVI